MSYFSSRKEYLRQIKELETKLYDIKEQHKVELALAAQHVSSLQGVLAYFNATEVPILMMCHECNKSNKDDFEMMSIKRIVDLLDRGKFTTAYLDLSHRLDTDKLRIYAELAEGVCCEKCRIRHLEYLS